MDDDRMTIIQELDEWAQSPLTEQMPGYLAPIAIDAGVPLSELTELDTELQRLDAKGKGGSANADRVAGEIERVVDELIEQVRNASRGQVSEYTRRRSEWIEAD